MSVEIPNNCSRNSLGCAIAPAKDRRLQVFQQELDSKLADQYIDFIVEDKVVHVSEIGNVRLATRWRRAATEWRARKAPMF